MTTTQVEEFLDAYITAALWSTNDESDESGGEPLDKNYDRDDLAQETLGRMRADCVAFLGEAGGLIAECERLDAEGEWRLPRGADCSIAEYAGHDFWLTRNGHGCGFWDGDWPLGIDEKLYAIAKRFGEVWLYVGDDGLIYGA